jgi:hypothetical protein
LQLSINLWNHGHLQTLGGSATVRAQSV